MPKIVLFTELLPSPIRIVEIAVEIMKAVLKSDMGTSVCYVIFSESYSMKYNRLIK
jgi:hypothetical protein